MIVSMMQGLEPEARTISEILALMPKESTGIIDEDYARDVEAAVKSRREPVDAGNLD